MPIRRYDKAFGGKRGAAAEVLAAMKSQYGEKRGTSIFYATATKRRRRRKRRKVRH